MIECWKLDQPKDFNRCTRKEVNGNRWMFNCSTLSLLDGGFTLAATSKVFKLGIHSETSKPH
jgi:hypothetical protein